MKQMLWVIALKGKGDHKWGESWAYNNARWSASPGGDVFFNISEVKNWLDIHKEFWTTDGRDFCIHCEEFEL